MGISLTDTANALQDMHRKIDGISYAPPVEEYSRNPINRQEFPAIFSYPEDGNWSNPFGMGCKSEKRVWRVVCIVADTQMGVELEALVDSLKLIDTMGKNYNDGSNDIATEYSGNLRLEINDEFPNDSGFDDSITHADTPYYGFTFEVLVWRKA